MDADADEQALQQAHALTGREQRFELWDRERLIACVRSGSRQ